MRAALHCRQIWAIAATICVPPCVAVCPQARGMSRKAPGRPGRPHPSYRGESEAPCAKDLRYGNNTVPQEFSGWRPVCRRAPITERGTRCATKPNTMRTHGIPSQPSASRGRGGNGPMRLASSLGHPACSVPGVMMWPGAAPHVRSDGLAALLPRQQSGGDSGRRTRAPCRSTSSELMCHAIPVSLTIEPRLSRSWR